MFTCYPGSAYGAALSTALALGIAAAVLYQSRLPPWLARNTASVWRPPLALLETLHSGRVNDYITVVIIGTALLGGVFFAAFR